MRVLFFILGIFILAASMAVPLPALDANAPFSSHMLRHTSLLLLVAPLLIMAIPPAGIADRRLTGLSRMTARIPFAAWLTGILVMWAWHVPGWYNSTVHADIVSCAPLGPTLSSHLVANAGGAGIVADRVLALLQDGSLLIGGFIFWWPVITPCRSLRLPTLRAVVYLASACICCSLLGLLITFARPGIYQGVALTDQQIGGMIMWVPCCFVYLTASMGLLIEWLSGKDADTPISISKKYT